MYINSELRKQTKQRFPYPERIDTEEEKKNSKERRNWEMNPRNSTISQNLISALGKSRKHNCWI